MSSEEALRLTKLFIETKPACSLALSHLKPGVEIRIMIEGRHECAVFYQDSKACLEARLAQNPDVEFTVQPEAIRRLSELPGDNMAKMGIEIVQEIIAGHIKLRVCGSYLGVLRNGYLSIIKEAGPEFAKFIASHGLVNISKVVALIKRLKT